jgi:hypothetical protein
MTEPKPVVVPKDANGTPLAKDDIVLIEAKVLRLGTSENYNNLWVETVLGRRPDGAKEQLPGFNSAVVVKQ